MYGGTRICPAREGRGARRRPSHNGSSALACFEKAQAQSRRLFHARKYTAFAAQCKESRALPHYEGKLPRLSAAAHAQTVLSRLDRQGEAERA